MNALNVGSWDCGGAVVTKPVWKNNRCENRCCEGESEPGLMILLRWHGRKRTSARNYLLLMALDLWENAQRTCVALPLCGGMMEAPLPCPWVAGAAQTYDCAPDSSLYIMCSQPICSQRSNSRPTYLPRARDVDIIIFILRSMLTYMRLFAEAVITFAIGKTTRHASFWKKRNAVQYRRIQQHIELVENTYLDESALLAKLKSGNCCSQISLAPKKRSPVPQLVPVCGYRVSTGRYLPAFDAMEVDAA